MLTESTRITLTIGQLKRLVKESDEVKLQMVALKKAFDEIKKGKQEAEAGNWKIEALGAWNDELDAPEHGGHWVYFKGAPILEVNYDTMEYCYLMRTAILSKEMIEAILSTLDCKDFVLTGDDRTVLSEDSQDWVYIDGIETTTPNRFGLNKKWKTWFFHTPQEALRFCKNMQDKRDGSSVDVIRHAFDRLKMHTKDSQASWEEAIELIRGFTRSATITIDLGDLGSIEVPGDMDVERFQTKILNFIHDEVERAGR